MTRGRRPWLSWISIATVCVAILLYWCPCPIDPQPYTYPIPLPRLEGPLHVNTILQRAERLFEGQLVGPESFAVDNNGTIYTGTADGKIFAITKQHQLLLTRTGVDDPGCGTFAMEPICGRPKGMKIGPDGRLYVVDSYKGLLRVDTADGSIETLVSNEQGSEGLSFKFLNGIDITKDGMIYFTDSSYKWDRRNFKYEVLETHQAGRVLQYNINTGMCKTLISNLYLPNGLALSRDQTFLIISEMSVARLSRYYLKGNKAGRLDSFLDNFPGFPDNIKPNSKGNFYVGMGSVRFEGSSPLGSFLDLVGPYPAVKRAIAKVTPLALYNVFMPKYALVVEVNHAGEIISSLHDPGAIKIGAVSEAFEHENTIYLGHYQSPYLGVLAVTDLDNT